MCKILKLVGFRESRESAFILWRNNTRMKQLIIKLKRILNNYLKYSFNNL